MRNFDETVLALRDEGFTLSEIGGSLGLTKQRIHQIEIRARLAVERDKLEGSRREFMKLSTRARNVLSRRKIHRLEDLRGVTERDLLSIPSCGVATAKEIIRLMNANGILIAGKIPPA